MNTSIEGGKTRLVTGIRGDWTGTVFESIYSMASGESELPSALFHRSLWTKVIVERPG